MTRHDRTWATQPVAATLAGRLRDDIAVRLIDILDCIWLPSQADFTDFRAAGWEPDPGNPAILRNPSGLFPTILGEGTTTRIGFKVEYVHEFVTAQGLTTPIEGAIHAPFRRVRFAESNGVVFEAIERRGSTGFEAEDPSVETLRAAQVHLRYFRTRRRAFDDVGAGCDHTDALVARAVGDLGQNWACWLWLRAEREYWEARNLAGRIQKARQEVHGIGWANQDHHTYDSSRQWFHRCVGVLETLGCGGLRE